MEKADYVFEVSWEVCNKVGGIYTVLSTKAAEMMEYYKKYFLVGPYFETNAKIAFKHVQVPSEFVTVFEDLKKEGIVLHFGIWNDLKAKPFAILIDFSGIVNKKNDLKAEFWNDFGIDSLRGYWDFEEPMLWSYAAGRIMALLANSSLSGKKIVGQFHEWMAGFGLLYLKKNAPSVATVFTTHATILGRTLAGSGQELYDILSRVDPVREAYNYSIEAKYFAERACAQNADTFTTVSEITSIEAEHFLGRKADVLVLNGLDIEKFPSFEQTSIKHIASRDKIREFLTYHFFPYYTFDLNHNLIFYTVGRFEFRNKGYDILIKALGALNRMLKEDLKSQKVGSVEVPIKTVSIFFWIPMSNHGLKLEVLENKNYYMHIKNFVNANSPEILTRLIYDFLSHKEDISNNNLFSEGFINEIHKDILAFERRGNPPLTTHNIDEGNILITELRNNGLLNRKEDLIKVIVEPVYLDGTDGFVDLAYYDAMVGCHLGLFPSYYEPWGYTPLESAGLGVPALTTDMSGFGIFVKSQRLNKKGLLVLDRFNKPESEVIANFTSMLYDFVKLEHSQRVECKLDAKNVSGAADWKFLAKNYFDAHSFALMKVLKRKETSG